MLMRSSPKSFQINHFLFFSSKIFIFDNGTRCINHDGNTKPDPSIALNDITLEFSHVGVFLGENTCACARGSKNCVGDEFSSAFK